MTPKQGLSGNAFLVSASSCSQCLRFWLGTRRVRLRAMARGQDLNHSVTLSYPLTFPSLRSPFCKVKTPTPATRLVHKGCQARGGTDWEFGTDMYTLQYLK